MKVSSPHMARIFSWAGTPVRYRVGGRFGRMNEEQATASHDPDFPETLLAFMRTGWADRALDVAPAPSAPNHAKRRAAAAEAFPGDTLVIPSGTAPVRANDTVYPFRPG